MKRLQLQATRHEQHGQAAVCKPCGLCGGKLCAPARTEVTGKGANGTTLRKYQGIRMTADGFDCALPVTIDSHSHCSFECVYCFSESLAGHVAGRSSGLGQQSLQNIDSIWSGGGGKHGESIRSALKFDRRNAHGFTCPVQLGGINDPGDSYERQQGWLLEFIKLAVKHNQPVRLSTKGTVLSLPEYKREIAKAPHLFWCAFSIISPDDRLLAKVDRGAPPPSVRLQVMKDMADLGCKTSLRFRPIIPGLSDSTPDHPHAYEELIARASDVGARAISFETCFVPTRFNKHQREQWDKMERAIGLPLKDIYKKLSSGNQACLRPSYRWTEDIMHAIAEVARHYGMTIGVSDPTWKQLSDTGCCCGMLPDDPVFGNWERENATNALVRAMREPGYVLLKEDITPVWAVDALQATMTNMGAGPKTAYAKRHRTWADKLSEIWDDVTSERGPLSYFQGALQPVSLENGDVGYVYAGLERQHKRSPYWRIRTPRLTGKKVLGCNSCGTEVHGHAGKGVQHRCGTHAQPGDRKRRRVDRLTPANQAPDADFLDINIAADVRMQARLERMTDKQRDAYHEFMLEERAKRVERGLPAGWVEGQPGVYLEEGAPKRRRRKKR